MIYHIYTDGAASAERSAMASAYVVLSDNKFIRKGFMQTSGLSNPAYAETLAVALASKDLIKNIRKNDKIVFHIDCSSTIKFINDIIILRSVPLNENSNGIISTALYDIDALHSKCENIKLEKVKAHKNVITPNSYVDRLAKLILRKGL